jgi:hypothetical protein
MARTIISGGGYNSRQVSHRREPKTEPVTHRGNPAGVAQQGMAVQFRKEPLQQGPHSGYEPGKTGSTGIANASKGPAGAGPGGYGRTIYKSGSQSPTPPAREMPAGRNTLSEFGRDVPGRGRR